MTRDKFLAGASAVLALVAAAAAHNDRLELALGAAIAAALLSAFVLLSDERRPSGKAQDPAAAPNTNEERVSALLNAVPQGAALFGPDGRLLLENGRWRDLVAPGASGAIVGLSFDDLMRVTARTALDAKGREDAWRLERLREFDMPKMRMRIPLERGRILHLDNRRQPGGEVVSIASDATSAETAAASLDALRQQAESFLDNIIDAVLVIDDRGIVERVNVAAERMFALPRGAIVGRSAASLFVADGPKDIALLGRDPGAVVGKLVEGQGKRSDGNFFPVEIALGEIASDWRLADRRAARRRGFVATLRDLTTKKEAERQLRQAQKLEAVGTLAGGIAHDFNNLLAIMLGYANLTLADVPEENVELRESVGAIEAAAKRGKDLVRQLLTFSRGGGEARASLDVVPLVKEAAKLIRATLPSEVEFDLVVEPTSAPVLGNATQIHQILINLCTNAVQALAGRGGKIELSVRCVERNALDGSSDQTTERFVVISVIDDGPGIDPAILDRIFEPFFTTKDVGQGSGLGLAVAHGIARDHGGNLRVESAPGRGAKFEALIPAHDGPIEAPPKPETAPVAKGHENILVVEFEPAIRHVIERHLTRLGYRVTTTGGSAEAFRILQAAPKAYDAIVSDLSMPGMTGTALTEALRAIGVMTPVIISTGGRKIEPERADSLGIVAQILKPALVEEIGPVLHQTLAQKS